MNKLVQVSLEVLVGIMILYGVSLCFDLINSPSSMGAVVGVVGLLLLTNLGYWMYRLHKSTGQVPETTEEEA